MPLEIGLTAAAMIYYARRTSAPTGNRRLWILGGSLAAVQAVDWFGAKAPDYSIEIPLTMLAAYIVLALVAAWAGANRAVVMAQEEAST